MRYRPCRELPYPPRVELISIRAMRRPWQCRPAPWREIGPCVHQPAPLVEQVATPIGRLDLVADRMRERHLDDFARKARALGGPVAETSSGSRARSDHRVPSAATASGRPCWRAAGRACRRETRSRHPRMPLWLHLFEDSERAIGQRHTVFSAGLHARGGNGPHLLSADLSRPTARRSLSPVLAAVRIVNSRARAAMPSCSRNATRKPGSSP